MRIEPTHPDANDPLLARTAHALEAAGALVVITPDAGNLVREARPEDDTERAWVVEAEGLPNLLHEYLHFVQFGALAVDHGIDYARIPFDTERDDERRLLWEELACCVVSCAYLEGGSERRHAWFVEQVGILHAFFGLSSTGALRAKVDALRGRFEHEWRATLDRAGALAAAGLGEPPQRVAHDALDCSWTQRGSRRGS